MREFGDEKVRRVQSESDIAVVDAGPDQESPLERREKGCVREERQR